MLLHECAHAYERMTRLETAPMIQEFYEECMRSGLYQTGERGGDLLDERPYAANNARAPPPPHPPTCTLRWERAPSVLRSH